MTYETELEKRNEKLEKIIEDAQDKIEALDCKLDVSETLLNLREEQLFYIISLANQNKHSEEIIVDIKKYLDDIEDFMSNMNNEAYRYRGEEN